MLKQSNCVLPHSFIFESTTQSKCVWTDFSVSPHFACDCNLHYTLLWPATTAQAALDFQKNTLHLMVGVERVYALV